MLCNKSSNCYFHNKDTCQETACLYHGERGLAVKGGEILWKVDAAIDLPDGFELREDAQFVYVYRDGDCVAIFNANVVTPETILDACKKK